MLGCYHSTERTMNIIAYALKLAFLDKSCYSYELFGNMNKALMERINWCIILSTIHTIAI